MNPSYLLNPAILPSVGVLLAVVGLLYLLLWLGARWARPQAGKYGLRGDAGRDNRSPWSTGPDDTIDILAVMIQSSQVNHAAKRQQVATQMKVSRALAAGQP